MADIHDYGVHLAISPFSGVNVKNYLINFEWKSHK